MSAETRAHVGADHRPRGAVYTCWCAECVCLDHHHRHRPFPVIPVSTPRRGRSRCTLGVIFQFVTTRDLAHAIKFFCEFNDLFVVDTEQSTRLKRAEQLAGRNPATSSIKHTLTLPYLRLSSPLRLPYSIDRTVRIGRNSNTAVTRHVDKRKQHTHASSGRSTHDRPHETRITDRVSRVPYQSQSQCVCPSDSIIHSLRARCRNVIFDSVFLGLASDKTLMRSASLKSCRPRA